MNKGSEWSEFLALFVNKQGVQLMPQRNNYRPQVMTYNVLGNKYERHSIHLIFKYMANLHGVPKVENSLILSKLELSKNPWFTDEEVGKVNHGTYSNTAFLGCNGKLKFD